MKGLCREVSTDPLEREAPYRAMMMFIDLQLTLKFGVMLLQPMMFSSEIFLVCK